MARLDAVQIKVTLTGPRAARATAELELASTPRAAVDVFFCERVLPHGTGLPLHDHGLILRLRRLSDRAEASVKLRPCRRSRLTPEWLGMHLRDGERFRLEEDWSVDRLLVAELDAQVPADSLAAARTGDLPIQRLFTPSQRKFVAECADVALPLDGLTMLGPIRVGDHGRIGWHGYDLVAQKWAIPGQEMVLELTMRVEPPSAEVTRRGFQARLAQHGIEQDDQERKTYILLDRLTRTRRRI